MRRLVTICLLAVACAHAPRSGEAQNWLNVRSEHFIVRTDLPEDEARKAAVDMELARTALLGAGWHSNREPKGRIAVVLLASEPELHEFARGGHGFEMMQDSEMIEVKQGPYDGKVKDKISI